ncbi:hypothetical protein [Methylomonas rapida]|uniref:Uncharacterized protein n=1 Tax=Methylomonas rapida TaxID=2963939 RepID=A0ABY7GH80_9GAMM|nr:hypothetical protein [Methylomonas rapida]WAR44610.1 hypothetical protein NM686_020030 [Methylomonas rapida]
MNKLLISDRDAQFIRDYEERIWFLKMAVLHTCPLSLFCSNRNCFYHCHKEIGHPKWVELFDKYDQFLDIFSQEGKNIKSSLMPHNWHTLEAKVIYFLLKNKHKAKKIKEAGRLFSIKTTQVDRIHSFYSSQKKDYLALSNSERNLDGYSNYKTISTQCEALLNEKISIETNKDKENFSNHKQSAYKINEKHPLCPFYYEFGWIETGRDYSFIDGFKNRVSIFRSN